MEVSDSAALADTGRVSLCDLLDRVLNKGAMVAGGITISVANVDLLYLDLHVVLSSVVTLHEIGRQKSAIAIGDE
jgi:hypothetical protein